MNVPVSAATGWSCKRRYDRRGVIYLVTCCVTGKVYVGQTRSRYLSDRWNGHVLAAFRGVDTHFYRAIRRYGAAAFTVATLEECPRSRLNNRERYYIRLFRSNDPAVGYNMSPGGDGGQNMTPETRAKISATKTGQKHGPMPEARKEAIRQAKLAQGYRHSETTLRKIRKKRRAYKLTEQHKQAIQRGLRKTRKFKLTAAEVRQIKKMLPRHSDNYIHQKFFIARRTVRKIRDGVYEGPQ